VTNAAFLEFVEDAGYSREALWDADAWAWRVEHRVDQLEVNLERWRWLPKDLGRRHILVNIAAFNLDVVEQEAVVMSMRVVVGRPYRRTPVFSDTMRYLVLNPYWQVPRTLAVQDLLPRIKRNVSYLAQQKVRVFQGWGPEAREVDPTTVDWSAITPARFPFRLAQDPGPLNALGRIKFMFLNKYHVYLHDTPAGALFAETQRDFSHGCIRVEDPAGLAEWVLRDVPGWTRTRIDEAMQAERPTRVNLREPLGVVIFYDTVHVNSENVVHFVGDIYGHDRTLDEALERGYPYPEEG